MDKEISNKREWVLASTKHVNNGVLQFWGRLTKDEEERSLGGYFTDINICERFTEEETNILRKGEFPHLNSLSRDKLYDTEHYWIKVSELEKANCLRKKTIFELI